MRYCLMILMLSAMMRVGSTAAQEAPVPLTLDEFVEGTLTETDFEDTYTFAGEAGQLILIEMLPKPGTFDIDGYLSLADADGNVLAENDDFNFPLALVVAELPAGGDYTIRATRSGFSAGSTVGEYILRARAVEPLAAGTTVEATITSDLEADLPSLFVLRPAESGPVRLIFRQTVGDLYAALRVSRWQNNSFSADLANLENTRRVAEAALTVELEAGGFYILSITRSFTSFVFEVVEATVSLTVE